MDKNEPKVAGGCPLEINEISSFTIIEELAQGRLG